MALLDGHSKGARSISPANHSLAIVLGLVLGIAIAAGSKAAEPPLPSYNAQIAQTSVSGISSGAFMAVQIGTAWSSIIKGVGAIAGGPFDCAQGALVQALSTCNAGSSPSDLPSLIASTDAWSHAGAIDAVS